MITGDDLIRLKALLATLAPIPRDVAAGNLLCRGTDLALLTDQMIDDEWMRARAQFAADIIAVFNKESTK